MGHKAGKSRRPPDEKQSRRLSAHDPSRSHRPARERPGRAFDCRFGSTDTQRSSPRLGSPVGDGAEAQPVTPRTSASTDR